MSVKIRLRRLGRKGSPYYHIVAADARSPRDGKFIERLGSYDPTTIPATIDVNHDLALKWLKNGAQPTETVRSILRYTGVNLKFALSKQGKDQETIDAIFAKWYAEKQGKIGSYKGSIEEKKRAAEKERVTRENEVREQIANRIAAKSAPPVEAVEQKAEEAEEAAGEEETATEA